MKAIRSLGGPYILIDDTLVPHWSGIDGKEFIGVDAPFANDYDAAGELTNGRGKPPVNIAKLEGVRGAGIIITMPLPTAVIYQDEDKAFIAQRHYAEQGWSFDQIGFAYFDRFASDPADATHFDIVCGRARLFDSVWSGAESSDDHLSFNMSPGRFRVQSDIYEPDASTMLTLVRLDREK